MKWEEEISHNSFFLGTHSLERLGGKKTARRLDLLKDKSLAGSRFMSERLNPSGCPGNVRLDEVRKWFNVASTDLTLVHLFNLQP